MIERIAALAESADYAALKELAAERREELLASWGKLKPMDKLVVFKLMSAPAALEFYERLPFREKYFLLCGFPLQSIAPVLEAAGPAGRRLFVQLPREFYDRMFRRLLAESPTLDVTVNTN